MFSRDAAFVRAARILLTGPDVVVAVNAPKA